MGYVISVVLIVASVTAMWLSARALSAGRDYATTQRGGGGLAKREMTRWEAVLGYGTVFLILALVLAPHMGLLLLSFATIWSYSPSARRLHHRPLRPRLRREPRSTSRTR